jgi:hypothetical protein
MKAIHRMSLATAVFLLWNALPAKAILYLNADPNFGPNSVTVDTSTGLGWLNLTETTGLSYNQVLAETQSGGMFSGFRFATVPEVLDLYSSAGLTASTYGDTTRYYPVSSPLIQTFFSLIGTSGIFNGLPGVIALSGTSTSGAYTSPSIYGWSYAQEYWVSDGSQSAEYGATYSFPDLSSWLVESVPEPAAANFLVMAAAALCGLRLLHRKKRVA